MPEELRITPARAGKTMLLDVVNTKIKDHPRSCGKDSRAASPPSATPGSPPLVRERLPGDFLTLVRIGITPARAGKTRSASD